MKKNTQIILSSILLAAAAALFAGCGGAETAGAAPASPAAESTPSADAITITGGDQMKFDVTEFTVKPGSEVTLIFKNTGTMPKESMGHNLVILVASTDSISFANTAARAPKEEYVPAELKESVVAATRILGPGETQTLTFTAPSETGDYPFICSFPGHAAAGMKGLMKVE